MSSRSAYREIDRNPPRRELVKLAAVFIVFLGAIGAHQMFVKQNTLTGEVIWAVGGVLAVLSLLPVVGRLVYIGWMSIGVTLGMVTQPIFLLFTYVLLFVPIGFVFRLMARDAMRRKLQPREVSYWEDYSESPEKGSYFKQY
jgi:uncharacterized membrane protein